MLNERLAEQAAAPVADAKPLTREAHPERARILGKPLAARPVLEMVRHEDGEISWTPRDEQHRLADRYTEIFGRL
jgi:hypothetical protein